MRKAKLNPIGKKKQEQLKKHSIKAYSTFAKKNDRGLKRSPLKFISKQRQKEMPEYTKLINRLRTSCGNVSELSGYAADWQSDYKVEPHHIRGRRGKSLLNPFGIIMLTRHEHDLEEGKIKGEKVGEETLLGIVKEIRLKQGFKPND